MCVAANKVQGVICGTSYNLEVARLLKEHNNANIITLGSDYINKKEAIEMIDVWRNATFLEGIYAKRIDIIKKYEEGVEYDNL